MSLVINGDAGDIKWLSLCMKNYQELCMNPTLSIDTLKSREITVNRIELTTKYYTASIDIHLLDLLESHASDEEIVARAEGYMLIPSSQHINLSESIYSLSQQSVEMEVGLRLLVVLLDKDRIIIDDRKDTVADHHHHHHYDSPNDSNGTKLPVVLTRRQVLTSYQEWALEYGFEYIEIFTGVSRDDNSSSGSSSGSSSIAAGFNDREKYGLPRLMEALQSNMWSTMQRNTSSSSRSCSSSSSGSSRSSSSSSRSGSSSSSGSSRSSSSSSDGAFSSVFNAVDHVSGSISSGNYSSNTEEVSDDVIIDNNIHQYQAMQDDDIICPSSIITTADSITHSSCSDNSNNIIDDGQNGSSNENLKEARAINNDHDSDNRDIAHDDREEDFAQLDVFSDFISQMNEVKQRVTTGTLSDSERREQAANMAMRLVQMMDIDSDDDDDDDDD